MFWLQQHCYGCVSILSIFDEKEDRYTYAEMAPPPLACPSIFVTIIAPKSALSLNARLCASAACPARHEREVNCHKKNIPMLASRTRTVMFGLTASPIWTISWNNSDSCLCRPDVSTMMTSKRSFLNLETPCAAMTTGSVSVYDPK